MKNQSLKNNIMNAICIIMLLLYTLIIGCPIRLIFGISCPGCGLTRAFISVIQLDFDKATYYHPLWFLFIVLFIVNILKEKVVKQYGLSKSFILQGINVINIIIGILFVLVYVYRIYICDPIMSFDIKVGVLYKFIKKFLFVFQL